MARSIHKLATRLIANTETFELPDTFTAEARAKLSVEMDLLYDLIDSVTESAMRGDDDPTTREQHQTITATYVTQIRCSVDILTALFNEVAFTGRPLTSDLRDTFARASQNVFIAHRDFLERIERAFIPPKEIDPRVTSIIDVVTLELPAVSEEQP